MERKFANPSWQQIARPVLECKLCIMYATSAVRVLLPVSNNAGSFAQKKQKPGGLEEKQLILMKMPTVMVLKMCKNTPLKSHGTVRELDTMLLPELVELILFWRSVLPQRCRSCNAFILRLGVSCDGCGIVSHKCA